MVPQKDVGATSGAIDDLLSDDAKRKKMGLAAKIFAQKMDWSQTVENYLKYYQDSSPYQGEVRRGLGTAEHRIASRLEKRPPLTPPYKGGER